MTSSSRAGSDRLAMRLCPVLVVVVLLIGGFVGGSGLGRQHLSAVPNSHASLSCSTALVGDLHDDAELRSVTDNAALFAQPGASWRGALTLVAVLPDPAWLHAEDRHGPAAKVAEPARAERTSHAVSCRGPPSAPMTYASYPSYIPATWAT